MTRRRITRWSGLLLLVAAWLLLQQLAWVHGLSHIGTHAADAADVADVSQPHSHSAADHDEHGHPAHRVCCACLGLHGLGAALPSCAPLWHASLAEGPAPAATPWTSADLAPRWAVRSRAPPSLIV